MMFNSNLLITLLQSYLLTVFVGECYLCCQYATYSDRHPVHGVILKCTQAVHHQPRAQEAVKVLNTHNKLTSQTVNYMWTICTNLLQSFCCTYYYASKEKHSAELGILYFTRFHNGIQNNNEITLKRLSSYNKKTIMAWFVSTVHLCLYRLMLNYRHTMEQYLMT